MCNICFQVIKRLDFKFRQMSVYSGTSGHLLNRIKIELLNRNNFYFSSQNDLIVFDNEVVQVYTLEETEPYFMPPDSPVCFRLNESLTGVKNKVYMEHYFSSLGRRFFSKGLVTGKHLNEINPGCFFSEYFILETGEIIFQTQEVAKIADLKRGTKECIVRFNIRFSVQSQGGISLYNSIFQTDQHILKTRIYQIYKNRGKSFSEYFSLFVLTMRGKKQELHRVDYSCFKGELKLPMVHTVIWKNYAEKHQMKKVFDLQNATFEERQEMSKYQNRLKKVNFFDFHEEKNRVYLYLLYIQFNRVRKYRQTHLKFCYIDLNEQEIVNGRSHPFDFAYENLDKSNIHMSSFRDKYEVPGLVIELPFSVYVLRHDLKTRRLARVFCTIGEFYKLKLNQELNIFYIVDNNNLYAYSLSSGREKFRIPLTYENAKFEFCKQSNGLNIYQKGSDANEFSSKITLDLDSFEERLNLPIIRSPSHLLKFVHFSSVIPESPHLFLCIDTKTETPFFGVSPMMGIINFPLGLFEHFFSRKHYESALRSFSQVYFPFLEGHSKVDKFFGPLTPLHLSIYHNDDHLLSELLSKYYYPKFPEELYVSPIEYASRLSRLNCIVVICEYLLSQRKAQSWIGRRDFFCLLGVGTELFHDVLARLFKTEYSDFFPKFAHQKSRFQLHSRINTSEYLLMFHERGKAKIDKTSKKEDKESTLLNMQSRNRQSMQKLNSMNIESIGTLTHLQSFDETSLISNNISQVLKISNKESISSQSIPSSSSILERPVNSVDLGKYDSIFESYDPLPKKKKDDFIEIQTKSLPIKIDLSLGSPDIIQILFYYSFSKSEKFILSDWKFIIQNRWNRFWGLHLARALLFWALSLSFMLYAIFFPTSQALRYFSLIMSLTTLVYEFFRFVGFCFFKVSV